MAKGTGLIGNFKGKVGNMVGYNLKDSNNKQTQGIRVYQPVVRNPKSYAQAQQRCIMKPINDFYRALKPVISRGQEGKAYGNASRLAWLKNVMKDFNGPWLVKGSTEQWPIACMVTSGSLPGLVLESVDVDSTQILANAATTTENPTIAQLSTALKSSYSFLEDGDQITIVSINGNATFENVMVESFVIDTTDTTVAAKFTMQDGVIIYIEPSTLGHKQVAGCVIVSREGSNGQHLRSTSTIQFDAATAANDVYKSAAKAAAIVSYMAAGDNTDWPQEALEG